MASRRQTRTAGNSPLNSLERMDWESLNLGELTEDPRLQMRLEGLDEKHVRDLMAVVEDKGIDEPITVIREGKTLWLADGFHRVEAYRRVAIAKDLKWEKQVIRAIVLTGTFDDAKQLARKANLRHGKALSPASRKAILFDMVRGGEEINGIAVKRLSNNVLAAELGVHKDTIAEWFEELIAEESTGGNPPVTFEDRAVVYGRDMREIKVAEIASSNQKRAAEAAERRAAEEAERKKNLPAIEKLRVAVDLLMAQYPRKPFFADEERGLEWCRQATTLVMDVELERNFLREYKAKPVGLYLDFLRYATGVIWDRAEGEAWTDDQLSDWVFTNKPRQTGYGQGKPPETFQQTGMAQPKNPNADYPQPRTLGRHHAEPTPSIAATAVEIEEQTTPRAPCPFKTGQNVQVIETGEKGFVHDAGYVGGEWHILVKLYAGVKVFRVNEINRIFADVASQAHETPTDPPTVTDDAPFYVDQRVQVIATGELDTVYNVEYIEGEWRIWLENGEDFNRVNELSPTSRFGAAATTTAVNEDAESCPFQVGDRVILKRNPKPVSTVKAVKQLKDGSWHLTMINEHGYEFYEVPANLAFAPDAVVVEDRAVVPFRAGDMVMDKQTGQYVEVLGFNSDGVVSVEGEDEDGAKIQYEDYAEMFERPTIDPQLLAQASSKPAPTNGSRRQAEVMIQDARSLIPALLADTYAAATDLRHAVFVRWEAPKSVQTILEVGEDKEIKRVKREIEMTITELTQLIKGAQTAINRCKDMVHEIEVHQLAVQDVKKLRRQ